MALASFDVTSGVDLQEVDNAVNQAKKEIAQRYDFKGSKSSIDFKRAENVIELVADDNVQDGGRLGHPADAHGAARRAGQEPEASDVEPIAGGLVKRTVTLQQGIPTDNARDIVKFLKDQKLKKVQATIQGDQLRVSRRRRRTTCRPRFACSRRRTSASSSSSATTASERTVRRSLARVRDVVIVGAGAAGLATAIFARRANPGARVVAARGRAGAGREDPRQRRLALQRHQRRGHRGGLQRRPPGDRPPRAARVPGRRRRSRSSARSASRSTRSRTASCFPTRIDRATSLDALLRDAARAGVELRAGTRVLDVTPRRPAFASRRHAAR